VFADALCSLLGISQMEIQWPIDLLLHDPAYVRAARADLRGGLRYAEYRSIYSDKPEDGPQYLHDWFFEQDGRLSGSRRSGPTTATLKVARIPFI
jgi:hypothetical protein